MHSPPADYVQTEAVIIPTSCTKLYTGDGGLPGGPLLGGGTSTPTSLE
jgi:hypothetical protein